MDNQIEQAVATDEHVTENADRSYGKFNTAEALLSAYNALEGEFTKRCQLIKQLQTELSQLSAQATDDSAKSVPDDSAVAPIDAAAEQSAKSESELGDTEKPHTEHCIVTSEPQAERSGSENTTAMSDSANAAEAEIRELVSRAAEYAELVAELPEVMDACVTRYKQRLLNFGGGATATHGAAVITPPRRPRTLAEAKLLADELIAASKL